MQRVLKEYQPLVVKMSEDASTVPFSKWNLDLLLDVQMFLTLPCITPLLSSINSLIKFSQSRAVFVYDYVQTVKMCQVDLFRDYVDVDTYFHKEVF